MLTLEKNKNNKKVGILGGTFNPIHNGHIEISKLVKEHSSFDEIWIMPTFKTSLKDETSFMNVVDPKKRMKMIKIAIEGEGSWLKLSDIEVKWGQVNYTIHTMETLYKMHPTYHFSFIVGSDSFNEIQKWYKYEELLNLVNFIVVKRGKNINMDLIEKYNITLIEIKPIAISSTKIRDGISEELNPKVKKYIAHNYLYLKNKLNYELSSKRLEHSLLVGMIARRIATITKYKDIEGAYFAGIMHDVTKEKTTEWHQDFLIKNNFYPKDQVMSIHPKILHAYTGAFWLREVYGLDNEKVFNSILYHTTGRKKMDTLEKIIYISDEISKNPLYEERVFLVETASLHLDYVLGYFANKEYLYLKEKNVEQCLNSKEAYEFYVNSEEKRAKIERIDEIINTKDDEFKNVISNFSIGNDFCDEDKVNKKFKCMLKKRIMKDLKEKGKKINSIKELTGEIASTKKGEE